MEVYKETLEKCREKQKRRKERVRLFLKPTTKKQKNKKKGPRERLGTQIDTNTSN